MLLASEDGRVDVKQSPLAKLGKAYDFSNIFGSSTPTAFTPGTASPYGMQPTQQNAPRGMGRPRGFAAGGVLDVNEELLRIIGEK